MLSKLQVNKILFIEEHIREGDLFIKELFKNLNSYTKNKLTKEQFILWLDSWEATAELDQDPDSSARIKKALEDIKFKKTPNKSWEEFKRSVGLS